MTLLNKNRIQEWKFICAYDVHLH